MGVLSKPLNSTSKRFCLRAPAILCRRSCTRYPIADDSCAIPTANQVQPPSICSARAHSSLPANCSRLSKRSHDMLTSLNVKADTLFYVINSQDLPNAWSHLLLRNATGRQEKVVGSLRSKCREVSHALRLICRTSR